MNEKFTVERIGEYKKAMKAFVKGAVKTKLLQDEDGEMVVVITKNYDKATNIRDVVLTISNALTGVTMSFAAEVPTRVYNKVEPALFDGIADQLAKAKNACTLTVR